MSKCKSSISATASSEVTMNLVEYDGDLSKFNCELLAGWFIANPNGPTAFALGFVEFENSRRMFYKWMHFAGGKTWLSRKVTSYFTDSDANFGEILFNELISINNEAIAIGSRGRLAIVGGRAAAIPRVPLGRTCCEFGDHVTQPI